MSVQRKIIRQPMQQPDAAFLSLWIWKQEKSQNTTSMGIIFSVEKTHL